MEIRDILIYCIGIIIGYGLRQLLYMWKNNIELNKYLREIEVIKK